MFFYHLNIPKQNNKNQYLSYSQYKSQKKKSLDYFTIDSIKIKNILDKKSLNSSYEKSFEEKNNEFINDKTLFEIQQKNCGYTQQLKFQHNIQQKKRINFQKSQSQIRKMQNQTNQFKNQRNQNINKNEKCIQQLLINSEIPQITARSWAIFNLNYGKPIYLKDGHKKREIASLTKIMTCYLSLYLIEKFQLNIYQLQFEVSQRAQNQIGTSSDLKQGYRVKIIDLLYALMLPSGNDAAYVLAENFGLILKLDKKNQTDQIENIRIKNYIQKNKNQSEIYDGSLYFINYMNIIANNLKLKNTYFDNMHGLMNKQNYSTAYDLSLLILKSMKNSIFLQIVSTKSYMCNMVDFKGNQKKLQFYIKIIRWQNTNKLLDNGFLGIKTGITDSAGPCLASYYKNENINIIVVVLKSQSSDHRWNESQQLVKFGYKILTGKNLPEF